MTQNSGTLSWTKAAHVQFKVPFCRIRCETLLRRALWYPERNDSPGMQLWFSAWCSLTDGFPCHPGNYLEFLRRKSGMRRILAARNTFCIKKKQKTGVKL
ncbi:MAG TPA: hypothetical protein IAB61_07155 [Candidatus Merdisoma merdipullorum]|nr:hypothetical protein [Candidatus Merdisoma merdipullorum]